MSNKVLNLKTFDLLNFHCLTHSALFLGCFSGWKLSVKPFISRKVCAWVMRGDRGWCGLGNVIGMVMMVIIIIIRAENGVVG